MTDETILRMILGACIAWVVLAAMPDRTIFARIGVFVALTLAVTTVIELVNHGA